MRMRSGKDVWQGWKHDLEKADEKPELGLWRKGRQRNDGSGAEEPEDV